MNAPLRYHSLPQSVVARVRREMIDEFGHALYVQPGEASPCRNCLRIATEAEPLILLSYRPFDGETGPYAETGPVFVHAGACEAYGDRDEFPPDFQARQLVLRAYDERGAIAASIVAQPGQAQGALAELFRDDRVRFVHARNVAYGCYNFSVTRG